MENVRRPPHFGADCGGGRREKDKVESENDRYDIWCDEKYKQLIYKLLIKCFKKIECKRGLNLENISLRPKFSPIIGSNN